MHLSGWVLLLSFGAWFSLCGHKRLFWRGFCPHIRGEDQKKRTKVFFKNTPQWHRSCCFLLEHDFRMGAQKPSLVLILFIHSGVKTKNKTKRSLSQIHPSGVGPVAFLWGAHSCLGAQKPPLVRILTSQSRAKTKTKTKRSTTNAPQQWCRFCCFLLGHNSHSLGGPHSSLEGHGPKMTPVASGLHGCFCRKFTALVL